MSRKDELWRKADAVMAEFPFDKVRQMMVAVGWKYFDSREPPTEKRLMEMARQLFRDVIEKKYASSRSGGFIAGIEKDQDGEDAYLEWRGAWLDSSMCDPGER